MSGELGALLIDTLRLAPLDGAAAALRARWSEPSVARHARAIAAWAAWEGTETWLRARLTELQVAVPPALADPLRVAGLRAAQGHLAIEAEGGRVHTLLADAGVPCVLIKGLARRAILPPRLLPTRVTSDVDILVRGTDAAKAWTALRGAGYEPLPLPPDAPPLRGEMWGESRHHLRPLVGAGGVAVDVHVSTSWELPPQEAWARLTATAREATWCGLQVRVPSPTEMAWHALTHAKVHTATAWRLWFWLDAAAALAHGAIDWTIFAARWGSAEAPPPATAARWLGAAAELAGLGPLPVTLAPARPYPLVRMMEWRLRAFGITRAVRTKLVDEATRAEAGLGLAPLDTRRTLPIHVRRRVASVAARVAYAVWSTGAVRLSD